MIDATTGQNGLSRRACSREAVGVDRHGADEARRDGEGRRRHRHRPRAGAADQADRRRRGDRATCGRSWPRTSPGRSSPPRRMAERRAARSDVPPALVWLRRDLRLDDQPAIAGALEDGGPVAFAFVLDEGVYRGEDRAAPRVRFALDGLRDLDQRLRERAGGLFLRPGRRGGGGRPAGRAARCAPRSARLRRREPFARDRDARAAGGSEGRRRAAPARRPDRAERRRQSGRQPVPHVLVLRPRRRPRPGAPPAGAGAPRARGPAARAGPPGRGARPHGSRPRRRRARPARRRDGGPGTPAPLAGRRPRRLRRSRDDVPMRGDLAALGVPQARDALAAPLPRRGVGRPREQVAGGAAVARLVPVRPAHAPRPRGAQRSTRGTSGSRGPTTTATSRPGAVARRATGSSTPACGSSSERASCRTACGWSAPASSSRTCRSTGAAGSGGTGGT